MAQGRKDRPECETTAGVTEQQIGNSRENSKIQKVSETSDQKGQCRYPRGSSARQTSLKVWDTQPKPGSAFRFYG